MMQSHSGQNKRLKFTRWVYVFFGIIIMICLGTVYSWSVFRLPVEHFFNVGTTQSGLPYMTALAFYALFMFLTGRYLDKYPPRFFIILGGVIVSLGWILSSFAPNIYFLTISYGIIGGAGVGIVYGAPMAVVAKWFPEKKGLAVGLVLIGFGLSPLITAPLARNLVECFGLMKTFLILGISFGIVTTILSFPFRHPTESENLFLKTKETKASDNDMTTANMIKSKNFKGLYLNFVIGTMIGLMLVGMTSNVGVEVIGLSSKNVTLMMAMFAIFNGIGRPVFGWLTDKFSSKKAMFISYGLIAFSAILILFADKGNVVLFFIAYSIFWFNLGGWLSIAPTSTLNMYGIKHYSQNYGVVFTAYGLGAVIGVVTSGLLIDIHGNYHYVFYFVLALCSLGALLTFKFISNK